MSDPAPRPYRVATQPIAGWDLLARVRFGTSPERQGDPRQIAVALPVLHGPADEYWLSPTPVRHGWQDGIGYAENAEVLFGHLWLPEADLMRDGLDRAVFHAYARINHFLHESGFRHWLRLWNFLERITDGEGDAERYRIFNIGRAKALALKSEFSTSLPAATAIGTAQGGLVLYFLGSRSVASSPIENPRQVPAYHYPRQYGVQPPSFSRAGSVAWQDGSDLLISGTASVVGHETRHVGDLPAQLDETFRNLDALAAAAQGAGGLFVTHHAKLYLQRPETLPLLLPRLQARWPELAFTCLHGEVCRRDLHLEIEAIAARP